MRMFWLDESEGAFNERLAGTASKGALRRFNTCGRRLPQEITYHGKPIAVVMSRDAYDHLTAPRESLVDFMRRSPIYGAEDIEFERRDSLPREVDL